MCGLSRGYYLASQVSSSFCCAECRERVCLFLLLGAPGDPLGKLRGALRAPGTALGEAA